MSNPSPSLAALLSFIFPGLGQAYAGQARKGLIWAIPMLLFIVGVLWLLLGGQTRLVDFVTLGRNQLALLIFNVAFFLYHVAAMIDAYDKAKRDRSLSYSRGASRTGPIALAALVAVTIVLHGFPEMYGIDAHNSYCAIFNCGAGDQARNVIPSFVPQTANPSFAQPSQIASASTGPSASAGGTTSPTTPGATGTPSGSGTPIAQRTPLPSIPDFPNGWPGWASDGRLNILLIGGDSRSDTGLDAKSLRTDSMILLSVDIQSGKAALFSFPRNLCTATNGSCGDGTRYPDWLQIKLPQEDTSTPAGQQAFPDGTFTANSSVCSGMNSDGLLTSLWHIAAWCSSIFQGSDGISGNDCQQQFDCERAWRALVGTLQIFTGQQIDGIIAVNLNGFVDLVSNLPQQCPTTAQRVALPATAACYGGLWLQTDSLQDDAYFDSQQQQIPVNFQPGCFYVDPEYSLAYARSRHQDSDYQRERRQQYVIQQVRRQLDPLALLPNIPSLLQVAQANLYTTFGDTDIGYLAQAASRVDPNRLYEEDFAPANVTALGSMQAIQDEVTNIFSTPEPQPQPQQQNNPCPAK
jgi:anionic cell wall polymer biosynthesis LytR-Cps2A-Psr (LCP) family protein/TM2 domain-containing membrane protein YozV